MVAPVATAPASQPGVVVLSGDVRSPGELTPAKLAALPQRTVAVEFASSKRTERHTETGVLLADILPPAALAAAPGKNPFLSFSVLGVGADGYAALLAYGEISPEFGNRGSMIATAEDGRALDRPRLVVPGDRKGGRYVTDLIELKVQRVAR